MLKKVLAVTALGAAVALSATPASAVVCADAYAELNGEVLVDQSACV